VTIAMMPVVIESSIDYPGASMSKPAAKLGDKVMGVDTHIVMVPSPIGPMPTPTPMPFTGILIDGLCDRVKIENDS
jgi:hypothetical protein